MADLLLRDLAIATSGRISFAAMPPRDGDLVMLRRSKAVASEVRPGDLYWALCGETDDGMCHIEEAFSRGAAGAVISGRTIEPWPGKFTVKVDNVRDALWQAAAHARSRYAGAVICVSGGEAVRETSEEIHRSLGLQLPGSLAELRPAATCLASDLPALGLLNAHPSHEYVVLPLPADQAAELAQRCCPHICVATAMGEEAQSVVRVLEALPEEGWAILNGDDAELRRAASELITDATRAIWYGRGAENDVRDHGRPVIALPAVAIGKILNISDLPASVAVGNVPLVDGQHALVRVPVINSWPAPIATS